MINRRNALLLIVNLCWVTGAALSSHAQAPLAESSPFSPPENAGVTGAASVASSSGLELRGVMWTDGGARFCIYDTARRRSVWVGIQETGYPFVLSAANPTCDAVTVDWKGRRLTLALREAKAAPSTYRGPVPSPVVYSPPGNAGSAAAPEDDFRTQVANEIEARRTKAMLEELQRRRAAQGLPPIPDSAQ
jgi:hypothetical protein